MTLRSLLPLVLTYFLDFIGLFMVVPIFAPTFLDTSTPFLSADTSIFARTMIIGSLVAMYGAAQFIGAPILGEFSDQFGRKKILLWGLVVFVSGYLLGAYSFEIYNLPLLYISRFLIGFASGNGAVLFAAVSERSTEKTRAANMGYLTGAAATGIVIGPFIGSHLIQSSFVSWFSLATPFWVIGFLGILNLLWLLFFFQDAGQYARRRLHFFTGIFNLIDCMRARNLRIALLSYFFFVLGTESIFVSLPIFSVQKFQASSLYLGYLFISASAMSSITSLFINPHLSKKIPSSNIYFFSLCLLIASFLALFIPTNAWILLIPYGISGIFMVLCWTHGNVIAASETSLANQGKVLGVAQSLLSLALIFGPLVIGTLAAVHYDIAVLFSPLSVVVSVIFIFFLPIFQKSG